MYFLSAKFYLLTAWTTAGITMNRAKRVAFDPEAMLMGMT